MPAQADIPRMLADVNDTGRQHRTATARVGDVVERAADVAAGRPEITRTLPVVDELAELLTPWRALRRGSTIAATGSPSLLMTLLGGAMRSGGWAAVVGVPTLNPTAAPEYAVDLARLALIPEPGPDWPAVVAALMDGIDLIAVAPPVPPSGDVARRLSSRARSRGSVLITTTPGWPGCDLTLHVTEHVWHGLGQGRGRLRHHQAQVIATGRGAATRARQTTLTMPPPSLAAAAGPQPRQLPADVDQLLAAAPQPGRIRSVA